MQSKKFVYLNIVSSMRKTLVQNNSTIKQFVETEHERIIQASNFTFSIKELRKVRRHAGQCASRVSKLTGLNKAAFQNGICKVILSLKAVYLKSSKTVHYF